MADDCEISSFKAFDSNLIEQDVRKIAEAELNERETDSQNSLDTLKNYLKDIEGLTPCLDDAFLLMFLRARKFDSHAALKLIKKYYTVPLRYPNMFRNFSPHSCINAMNANLHYFLPYRNADGTAIMLSRFGQWDPRTLSCEELLKFNIVCIEMAIQNPVTQICGACTIADMKDFSWSQLLQIQISDLRCFVSTMQDCLPVRHKAIHIVHNSSIFSVLFELVKPLLSGKLKKRIYFHGDDLNSLHKHIPPAILPENLGGRLSNAPNEDFYRSMLDNEEYFAARQGYGYRNSSP